MVDDFVRGKGHLTLGSRMKRIGERLQSETQQLMIAQSIPIPASQYPLLASLDEYGPLAIGDLADALGVSQPGITRSVGQLVRQRLVSIRRGKKDQRTKLVALTELGRGLVQNGRRDIWPQIEHCLADILSGRTGTLLEQLDILEDALNESSFSQRISKANSDSDNG
jgi:DNA-binding MarR family transcriptional regulator